MSSRSIEIMTRDDPSPPSNQATKRKLSPNGTVKEDGENHRGTTDRDDETSREDQSVLVAARRSGSSSSNGGNKASEATREETSCPYLDSIQRTVLDFDFEPACSVSLETGPHIYGCLVCGKYFRGKGPATPAYTHSVEESHFVFVHLRKGTFVCLPDGYEVRDPSLDDIKASLHPTFTREQIAAIDTRTDLSRDLFGRRYLPGFVGLNNLNKTDCLNAVVQALAHVPPLRDYFLAQRHDQDDASMVATSGREGSTLPPCKASKRPRAAITASTTNPHYRAAVSVTKAFGELVRKIWCPHRFKSHVDPHILVQAVSNASNKKFHVGRRAEAGELMAWFLHQLHLGTGGGKKQGSSIVHKVFQGDVQVTTRQAKRIRSSGGANPTVDTDDRAGSDVEEDGNGEQSDAVMAEPNPDDIVIEETTVDTHFLQLTLDIPEKPLFRDEDGGLVIPQEPFVNVLKKFDGVTLSDALSRSGEAQKKRYKLRRLPNYLILHLARFKENKYSREKNPAIVTFPLTNFDLTSYVDRPEGTNQPTPPTAEDIRSMSVSSFPWNGPDLSSSPVQLCLTLSHKKFCLRQIKELKALLKACNREDLLRTATEKSDLTEAAVDFVSRSLPDLLEDKYFLCANLTHQSPAEVGREGVIDPLQVGSYKCHVQHRGTRQWYEIQDLHVQEIMPQQIGLTESNLLIFERKSSQLNRQTTSARN